MKNLVMFLFLSLFASAALASQCGSPEDVGYDPTGQKRQIIKESQESAANPAGMLFGCFASFKDGISVSSIKSNCGCVEAIRQTCSFRRKDGKWRISASGGASTAWCAPFVPY